MRVQAGQMVAEPSASRKVRSPQSKPPGNSRGGATCRIGPQRHTALIGKGEKVV